MEPTTPPDLPPSTSAWPPPAAPAACLRCGRVLAPSAKFCPGCGRPTPKQTLARARGWRVEQSASHRAVLAVALTFGGVLACMLVAWAVLDEPEHALVAAQGGFALIGVAAALLLRARREDVLPLAGERKWVALALPLGVVCACLALGYMRLLQAVLPPADAEPNLPDGAWAVLGFIVLAPPIEEFVARGVMWHAMSRLAGKNGVIWTTAALFALMHGLEGGLFSVPHRLAGGLVLGWLRFRSGSLVAPIAAHVSWNVVAVMVG